MKHFRSLHDVKDIKALIRRAITIKRHALRNEALGRGKTLGLMFMNPSLRTRMSTQIAAANLGMQVAVLNAGRESWALEFNDEAVMDGEAVEHVREAAAVLGEYCDIIGLRSFAGLTDRAADYAETMQSAFVQNCSIPLLSLESATRHPLQSLADAMTIEEYATKLRPKVVLSWAPHPRALPQAVANSFAEWMGALDADLWITQPEGFDLATSFSSRARVCYDQDEALKDADFVYVKNWSSYDDYGQRGSGLDDWQISRQKMALTNDARLMHCLPVRRNVVVESALLDGPSSLVIPQAANRVYAAQAVLETMLTEMM